jgi:hypothetical protein
LARESGAARTIDEVIDQLDEVIARSMREQNRLGYFAALYRKVTAKVKEGIAEGRFDNGPRMEQFDVTFANRYLTALGQFQRGEQPSLCWLASFRAAASWRPIILQQLLLGMNAHINFDLGIAAAEVAPGEELPSLEHDFNEINIILAGLVANVMSEIDEVSPWIGLVFRLGLLLIRLRESNNVARVIKVLNHVMRVANSLIPRLTSSSLRPES